MTSDHTPSASGPNSGSGLGHKKTANDNPARPSIMVGLQGGGAHGAFTWGVLDALFEANKFDIAGFSGTSSGALTAAFAVDGMLKNGTEGARRSMRRGWEAFSEVARDTVFGDSIWIFWMYPFYVAWNEFITKVPQETWNPLGYNPLVPFLKKIVDFDALRKSTKPVLMVNAADVKEGREKIFAGTALSAEAIAASGSIQPLSPTAKIGKGEYWDGAYISNPSILPLVRHCPDSNDLLIVLLNPVKADSVPVMPADKERRIFHMLSNSTLMKDLTHLQQINRFVEDGRLAASTDARPVRIHMIEIDLPAEFGPESRYMLNRASLERLFEIGRKAGTAWLKESGASVGKASSFTLDLLAEQTASVEGLPPLPSRPASSPAAASPPADRRAPL